MGTFRFDRVSLVDLQQQMFTLSAGAIMLHQLAVCMFIRMEIRVHSERSKNHIYDLSLVCDLTAQLAAALPDKLQTTFTTS